MTSEPVTSSEAAAMPSPVWTGRPLDWPGSFAAEKHDFLVRDVTFAIDRCPLRGQAALGLAHLRGFAISCLRPWQVSNLTAAMNVLAPNPSNYWRGSGVV